MTLCSVGAWHWVVLGQIRTVCRACLQRSRLWKHCSHYCRRSSSQSAYRQWVVSPHLDKSASQRKSNGTHFRTLAGDSLAKPHPHDSSSMTSKTRVKQNTRKKWGFMEHICYIHRRNLGGCKEGQMPRLPPPPLRQYFFLPKNSFFSVTELKRGK
jgi:hypothetical protein